MSDDCKISLASYLPAPEQSFEDRLVVLGTREAADGNLSIYLHGADRDGNALGADAFASLGVSVGGVVLAEGDFTITVAGDLSQDIISLGIVNDYSGSMSEADLDTVAEIETDLVTYLPPIHETEVTFFSTEVTVKQPFTGDRDAILAAVARDETFERDMTALYDGMGTALESLIPRERPVRMLLVSTDGEENESKVFEKSEILQMIAEEDILVVMLGALFADIGEIKDLAGPNGIYFYTPLYEDLRDQVAEYLDSLAEMVELTLPPEHAGSRPIEIDVGGVSAVID